MKKPELIFRGLLETADNRVNGDRPGDIQVHDTRLFERVLRDASLDRAHPIMTRPGALQPECGLN